MKSKTVVVGITGSIASYKAAELVRLLTERKASVYTMLSAAASRFISPLTLSALTGHRCLTDLFDPESWDAVHLKLADMADVVIIAPATADIIARLAGGISDDVITTCVLATKAPVIIVPAMHDTMWTHPATQTNVKRLKSYGYMIAGPAHGKLADGKTGIGRMIEPIKIVETALK